MLRKTIGGVLLTGVASVSAAALSGNLVVIVSAKNPVSAMNADQVASIFLAQSARFPDNHNAFAVDQALGSPQRDAFYARVTAKSPALLKSYWTRLIFTGRAQPPREVADSARVRKLVADDPSLIGYIDQSELDASVKAVLVVR
jgi:ABC-type phosphate transport system substrate-binding protein